MLESLPYWLHLIAAAAWVGPQFMMFLVLVPALGRLSDDARVRLMGAVSTRFGWLGGIALAFLVLTGIDNINRYSPTGMFDIRYGYILTLKITAAVIVILLTIWHTAVVGPRLLRLQEAAARGGSSTEELGAARRGSVMLSSLTLVLSLLILFAAALLRGAWAYGSV